jgi:hypothetical protein
MRWLKRVAIGLVVLFVVIQVVPYGRDHTNPPVGVEPLWASAEVKDLAKRACFDCHSHETVWPWYANVAPASWILQHHVEDGRRHLNFSMWNVKQKHAHEMPEVIREGEMPMKMYLPLHSEARLSDAERETLASALEEMPLPAGSPPRDEGANAGSESDGDGADRSSE